MCVINKKDEQTGTLEEQTKDPTSFITISLNFSNEKIAPSTSKQTETVKLKSFSKHSIQKKEQINKKRNFFGTKFSFKKRSQISFVSKSAGSFKRHLNVVSESDQEENSNKRESNQTKESSNKEVNKNFKVNNFI